MRIDLPEARRILGSEAELLSDADIEAIIASLERLANELLDLYEEGNL